MPGGFNNSVMSDTKKAEKNRVERNMGGSRKEWEAELTLVMVSSDTNTMPILCMLHLGMKTLPIGQFFPP